jgi:glycosyltransferase involved in cell wall biosynthesis
MNYRVIYGPEIWSLQSQGGISRYVYELTQGMILKHDDLVVLHDEGVKNAYLDLIPKSQLKESTSLSDSKVVRDFLKTPNSRVIYHATYYNYWNILRMKAGGALIALTVHDMISELFPDPKPLIPRINHKSRSIAAADLILCNSRQTLLDLEKFMALPNIPKVVTPLGISKVFETGSKVATSNERERIILFVGKREGYKNFENFIQAYQSSNFLKGNYKIIAFGGGAFTEQEFDKFEKMGIQNLVEYRFGDDSTLSNLYAKTAALVYPSIYEGFGLPIIEALSRGCAVFLGKTGASLEVAADAGFYFDPNSPESIRNIMEQNLQNVALISEKQIKGLNRVRNFDWSATVLKTDEAYSGLVSR